MKHEIFAAGPIIALSGCMTGPTVQSIASKAESVTLDGYTLSASHEVRVDCRPVGTRALTTS
jgi:hypothetical protein